MAKGKPNEIRIVRVYSAPVKLVWECFTDEKHQVHWWGPRGFTITTKFKDLRVGGAWSYTMHGPDGVDYPNYTTYHVVDQYSKLVYDHGAGGEGQPPLFRVTVTFEEFKGKTVMDMAMAFESEAVAKEMSKFIKQASGNSTWDRLGEYLEHEQTGNDLFIINRSFEAPRARVFEMFTKSEHLAKWLPPQGFSMEYINAELKQEGTTFYKMKNGEMSMFGKMTYKEINPVSRIVYSQIFTNEKGDLSKPPFEANWPDKMLVTICFEEESENETRVTLTTKIEGQVTEAEKKMFIDSRDSMTQGWNGSFDSLEELLK